MALSFDGQDDYVNCGHDASITSIANNFTIAFWAKPLTEIYTDYEATGGASGVWGQRFATGPAHGNVYGGSEHAGVGISIGTNGVNVYEHSDGYLPALLAYSGSISDWNHIVLEYIDKTPHLFLNGELVRTGLTSPKTYVHPGFYDETGIGGMNYGYYYGYLADVRIYNRVLSQSEIQSIYRARSSDNIVNGLAARWLLDEETEGHIATPNIHSPHSVSFYGNAQLDTADKKFGTAALLLNGDGDYLKIDSHPDFDFRSLWGRWTIDFWAKLSPKTYQALVSIGTQEFQAITIGVFNSRYTVIFSTDGAYWNVFPVSDGTVNFGVWEHWQLVYDTAYLYLCINGNAVCVAWPQDNIWLNNFEVKIGGHYWLDSNWYAKGYIDELRISRGLRGVAVPSSEYSTDNSTVLLLHFNGTDGATSTIDSSGSYGGKNIDISGNNNHGTPIKSPYYKESPLRKRRVMVI